MVMKLSKTVIKSKFSEVQDAANTEQVEMPILTEDKSFEPMFFDPNVGMWTASSHRRSEGINVEKI